MRQQFSFYRITSFWHEGCNLRSDAGEFGGAWTIVQAVVEREERLLHALPQLNLVEKVHRKVRLGCCSDRGYENGASLRGDASGLPPLSKRLAGRGRIIVDYCSDQL